MRHNHRKYRRKRRRIFESRHELGTLHVEFDRLSGILAPSGGQAFLEFAAHLSHRQLTNRMTHTYD